MASRNQVTLTFAGESKDAERAFERVGQSSREMASDVDSASSSMRDMGGGFDRVGEAADDVDTKAMGFRDTITGVQDTFKGLTDDSLSLGDRMLTLGMGIGDLASGFYNFLIPAVKSMTLTTLANARSWVTNTAAQVGNKAAMIASTTATKAMTVAQRALNLVMKANPILLVVSLVAALVGILVTAYKRSETFRRIVDGAFRAVSSAASWMADRIGAAVGWISDRIGGAASWIRDRVAGIGQWFRDLPGNIRRAFSTVYDTITSPFRRAFDGIKRWWNSTVAGFGFTVPSWIPGVGGKEWRIPYMHTGGIVPGLPGSETLIMARAGERVTPAAHADTRRGGDGLPDEFTLVGTVDLGEGIAQVVELKLRRHNRGVKRAVTAGATRTAAAT